MPGVGGESVYVNTSLLEFNPGTGNLIIGPSSTGALYVGSSGFDYGTSWTGVFKKDQNAPTLLGLINNTVGTSAAAQLELLTGTAFSYVNSRLNDNNGSPYYTLEGGSAVNNAYYHFNNHYWGNQAGTNFAALTSSGYFGVGLTGPNSVIQSQYASGLYTNAEGSVHGFQTQTGETTSDYTLYMGADKTHGVAYIQGVNWGVTYAPLVLNGRGGSVGIGTPSPAYTLDVSGSIRSSVNFIPGTVSNTGGGTWQFGSGAWSGTSPATTSVNSVTGITYTSGSGSQLFTLSSVPGQASLQLDGSLFVGDNITYNPSSVSGSSDGYLVVEQDGSFGGNLNTQGYVGVGSSSQYGLYLGGNQINTPGYNGLAEIAVNYAGYQNGTTQYRNFLVYNGKSSLIASFAGTTSSANFFGGTSTSSAVVIATSNQYGGTQYAGMLTLTNLISGATNINKFLRLNNVGGFEIVNNAYNSVIFSVSDTGAVTATGDITAYASDIRLKQNIVSIDNALDKVNKIRGVTFDWKDAAITAGFTPTQMHDVGVIAQEIDAVLPEAVRFAPFDRDVVDPTKSKSGENYLTVQYEKLTALLIEAVKELGAKVERLQGEIDQLKG